MPKYLRLKHGGVTAVDDADYVRLSRHRWYLSNGYATTKHPAKPGGRALHLFLLHTTRDQVDHINGDKLDNRRSNLRSVTRTQQSLNKARYKNNTSGFKGVSFHAASGRWRARLRVAGVYRLCKLYGSPEEAARAYDQAARRFCRHFATFNFPRVGERPAR